jgi:anti-sigma regulatory factor (Ser/Thr protein kinase)
LQDWHCDAGAETAELLVSEVVTNAIRHAQSEVDVIVRLGHGVITVEVHDQSADTPKVQVRDATDPGGLGLKLVGRMSRNWGFDRTPQGKVVWFQVAV